MVYQQKIADAIVKNLMARNYSQLALFMEILARSIGDQQMLNRIKSIKENCSIEFESFCRLYAQSFVMPGYWGIRFLGNGHRMRWTQVLEMGNQQIATPLQDAASALMGKVSFSQNVLLMEYLRKQDEGGEVSLPEPKIDYGEKKPQKGTT